jgi:2-amino-4-hydroxy-6-hydroxymethyldihydropteridine diphosphokinase
VRRVALALGSNLGAREANLAAARREIAARMVPILAASRIYETEPVGPPGQGLYLNQVLVVETAASPEELVRAARAIEQDLGRRPGERWGPRVIDIDLLLCGDEVHVSATAIVPHPRLHERAFVLVPLAEVMPEWRHPLRGADVRALLAACGRQPVKLWEEGAAEPGA